MRCATPSIFHPANNRRNDVASNDPIERSLIARMAAHRLHAQIADPAAHTAPGRAAFAARFEKLVDADGVLAPAERARRADHAKRAYFAALALKSRQARRSKKDAAVA